MTAISRAEMRSTIRLRGDYTNIRRFPDTYLDTEMQTAFGHFWRIVDEAHQGWWDKASNVTTVSGQSFLALPTDAKVIKGLDRDDAGEWREMAQVGIDQRNRFGTTQDKPLAFRLSSQGLELYPTPNAAYTLRVIYTPKPPQLTENTQYEFYDGWEDYVIEKVLFELDSREGKSLNDRVMKLDLAEKALRASTAQRRQSEPEYLNLREQLNDPFDDGILG